MAMATEDVLKTLNDLIHAAKDGEEGYRNLAEDTYDNDLKTIFTGYSRQRAQLASELQAAVRQLGSEPSTSGSAFGTLHRGFANVKITVFGDDAMAALQEAVRGDEAAVDSYEEALRADLPADVRSLVQRQLSQVRETRDRMLQLKKAREP